MMESSSSDPQSAVSPCHTTYTHHILLHKGLGYFIQQSLLESLRRWSALVLCGVRLMILSRSLRLDLLSSVTSYTSIFQPSDPA